MSGTLRSAEAVHSGSRVGLNWFETTFLPVVLIILSPPTTLIIWYTNLYYRGSVSLLAADFVRFGPLEMIGRIWGPVFLGSHTAWVILAVYGAVELLLMRVLPGRTSHGPLTNSGHIP